VNSEQTMFSGQAQVAEKTWVIKNISIQWKISRHTLFSGQGEKFFNTVYSASKGNCRKVSCLGEYNTQGTSPTWVNNQCNCRICLITAHLRVV